ncbi:hypothetical protein Tco_0855840 [Tanacetum coccineum]
MFRFNRVKKILVPLIDNNDTKVSKPTQDDSKVTGQQDLKEEPKDKIVTDTIVATTVLHDDIWNKIPKNLKLLDEVSQARIPYELQPIISPMQDIPLLNFSGHDIEKEHMVQNMEVIHGVKKQHVEFDCEEDDMFEFQQDVLFVLGGNSRTSFVQEGDNDAIRVGIG